MHTFKMLLLALPILMLFGTTIDAQFKIDIQTCETMNISQRNGAETAVCAGTSKTFQPKGTSKNVNVVASFPAVPTGAGVTFMVTKNTASGESVENRDYVVTPTHTTAHAQFTINTPGKYFVRMVNYYDKSQVWASAEFSVVGTAPVKDEPAKKGKVSVCKEIDDDWKCVGESAVWPANTYFNVNFENPVPVGVDFIGIVIHKQGADGKDTAFVNEFQQQIGSQYRKYATVGNSFSLPAGTYSIYIISWGNRESLVHNGNFTEYFAKTTLTVK